jgi:predicted AAA+ superfamily ATPase
MFKRHIEAKINEALTFMPIVLLRGARQTGKTTLAKMLSGDGKPYTYLSLDHLPSLIAAKEDPIGFVGRLKKPVIIDEIQRVPELFLPIKMDVDEHRTPGRYFLTGSADPLLIPQLGDSLAGRLRLLNLWPFSQGEIEGTNETFLKRVFDHTPLTTGWSLPCSKEDMLNRALRGGYPTPLHLADEKQRMAWFNDYVSLVLQKDILDLSKIENVTQIPQLLMLLASRSCGLLNTEELARTVKLSSVTLHRYIDLIKTLFLIHLAPAWSGNLGKRLVKSPKVYLTDTALQLFLLNIDANRLRNDNYLIGSVIENFVVLELLKQTSWSDLNIQMFHYRDYQHAEIDIILEGPGGDIVAIEIKSSETVTENDVKGLKMLRDSLDEKFVHGILLYAGTTSVPYGEKITALPISSLWSEF